MKMHYKLLYEHLSVFITTLDVVTKEHISPDLDKNIRQELSDIKNRMDEVKKKVEAKVTEFDQWNW